MGTLNMVDGQFRAEPETPPRTGSRARPRAGAQNPH